MVDSNRTNGPNQVDRKPRRREGEGALVAERMEPRNTAVFGWSPARVQNAERECAAGNYSLAADLCESMFADERVSKSLRRLYATTTLPLSFKMPGKDSEQSQNDPICQALDYDWWRMFPETVMREMVNWLGTFFCVLAHIDGWRLDSDTGRILPVISVWSPRNVRWDGDRGWVVRARRGMGDWFGIEETIVPGQDGWILMLQGTNYRAPYHAPWVGIANWFLLGKLYAPIDWASSSERHGQGIGELYNTLSGSSDMADTGENLTKRERAKTAQELSAMGRNANIVPPRGWRYAQHTDGANTYQTFAKQTDYANSAIDIGLTGTNLTTEVEGGSYKAASVHVSIDSVTMRSLLELLATQLREQVLVHWHALNFGSGVAPYPCWDTTPPDDERAKAEARKADADALKAYRDAGAELDQKAWFEGKVQLLETAGQAFPPKQTTGVLPNASIRQDDRDVARRRASERDMPGHERACGCETAQSRDTGDVGSAFAAGRDYTDRLEDSCCEHAAIELAPTLAATLSAINRAKNYDELEAMLLEAYREAKPVHELVALTEQALVMAQMAGQDTIEQELQEE